MNLYNGIPPLPPSSQSSTGTSGTKAPSFTMHIPPDVTKDTRIVAVCGINPKWASPRDDGWFFSDFCAFWHLLNGLTTSQTWLHSLHLDKCLNEYDRYIHGNPFGERREVLNRDILEQMKNSMHAPQRVPGTDILERFRETVFAECKEAHENKSNVLVLMFGHGDFGKNGIEIGVHSIKTLRLMTMIKELTIYSDARITILSTACFSGGWSVIPDLRPIASTMMAAVQDTPSRSWNYSYSFGRASGSMFATAVIDKLTSLGDGQTLYEAADEEETPPAAQADRQQESYGEFCSTIYEILLKGVDRRGLEHGITFSAQDDNWSSLFSQRVGIPIADFQTRWSALPRHPGRWTNRDSNVTAQRTQEDPEIRSKAKATSAEGMPWEAEGSILEKRTFSGLYGGEPTGLIRQVCVVGRQYLESYRGFDDTGDDGSLHNLIRRIISGRETDADAAERAWTAIHYRMEQMSTADYYLTYLQLPPPDDLQCSSFDTTQLDKKMPRDKLYTIMRMAWDEHPVLFPGPTAAQGRPFRKGLQYLAYAFHAADLSKDEVQAKLTKLDRIVSAKIEEHKEEVKRDRDIRSQRQRLFGLFGKVVASVSPSKRRSRGLSLQGM
ncbi:MAG: hypothetical protein Q9202_004122 [Teloschistes flavicans]